MKCCIECFCDKEIRQMIKSKNTRGDCDFCGREKEFIFPLDERSDLSDVIDNVCSVYEENVIDGEPLFDILLNDWNIFNNNSLRVNHLIEKFCDINNKERANHNINVCIPQKSIDKYGIFSGHSWNEFSEVIKTQNRFHYGFFKADKFTPFLTYAVTKYKKGSVFYRARVCNSSLGFKLEEMGAPPFNKSKSGRLNPEGIQILYLTSDERTCLNEVRASVHDVVSLAKFRLTKDIHVVNISNLKNISPVLYTGGLESLASNVKIFKDIARDISKPLRRTDNLLEYLPTQFIAEFIKGNSYSGVEYTSTMGTGGDNIAAFETNIFEPIEVRNVEITRVEYSYQDYNTKF